MKAQKILHGTGIIILAVAGSTILVLLLSVITNMLTAFDRSAASFLPATSTLALLHNPTRGDTDLIPELRDMINVEAAALLALPNGEGNVPVFFIRAENHLPDEHSISLGVYRVFSPSKEAQRLLAAGTHTPLSKDPVYEQLSNGRERSSSWVFMRREILPPAQTIPEHIIVGLLFQQADAFAIAEENGVLSITLSGMRNMLDTGVAPPPRGREGDILIVHLRRGDEILQHMLATMHEEDQTILRGILEQLLQEKFGEAVSLPYDILHLFRESISLRMKQNASGSLLTSIRGEMRNNDMLAVIIERLHEGTRLRLPMMKTTTYSFDNRFSTRNIRNDHSNLKEELFMLGDWQIRGTQAMGNATGLFTAVRKGEFIIANTREMLLSNLQENDTNNAISPRQRLIVYTRQGSGWLKREAVLSFLEKYLPAFTGTLNLPILPDLPETITWSMDRKGVLTIITLQPEK